MNGGTWGEGGYSSGGGGYRIKEERYMTTVAVDGVHDKRENDRTQTGDERNRDKKQKKDAP